MGVLLETEAQEQLTLAVVVAVAAVLAQTPAATSALFIPGRPDNTSWRQDTLARTV